MDPFFYAGLKEDNLLSCFLLLAAAPLSVEATSGKEKKIGKDLFGEMLCHSFNERTSFIHTMHDSGWSPGKQAVLCQWECTFAKDITV